MAARDKPKQPGAKTVRLSYMFHATERGFFVTVQYDIKYKTLFSLHYSATKSHIQNSINHFARTQSDRTTNWLPLQTMWRDPI